MDGEVRGQGYTLADLTWPLRVLGSLVFTHFSHKTADLP
jgi:hypothetical protein